VGGDLRGPRGVLEASLTPEVLRLVDHYAPPSAE
jgi:hypothetical protein